MQETKQLFPISATDNRAGVFLTPNNFLTAPAKSIPLIVFWHGVGQAKPDNISDINAVGDATKSTGLYANGSPLAQAVGGLLNSITCPVTGKVYTPAIFALQGISPQQPDGSYAYGWCVSASEMAYAIRQLVKAHPQLDDTGMLATGLSAGGATAWQALYGPDYGLYAAGVPLSTPAIDSSNVDWSRPRKAWAFHGTSDLGNYTNIQNSVWCVGQANAAHPGAALLQSLPGGHDASVWNAAYSPTNRWPLTFAWDGKTATVKNVDMYEFWLACRNANFSFGGTTTSNTNNPPQPTGALKAIALVSINGNVVTFDSTTSIGDIGSCDWYVTTAAGAYVNLSGMGLMPQDRKIVAHLDNGTYNARLTLYDHAGNKSVVNYPFAVSAVVPGPVALTTFPYNGAVYTAYSDNTWK